MDVLRHGGYVLLVHEHVPAEQSLDIIARTKRIAGSNILQLISPATSATA